MAIDFVAAIHVYQGDTDDEKPLPTLEKPIPVGSTFTELDGEQRTWVKTSPGSGPEWIVANRIPLTSTYESQSLAQGKEIIRQLKKLNED